MPFAPQGPALIGSKSRLLVRVALFGVTEHYSRVSNIRAKKPYFNHNGKCLSGIFA